MSTRLTHSIGKTLIGIAALLSPAAGDAALQSRSGEIVVLQAKDLPVEARQSADALFLHASEWGGTYLYLEQANGSLLQILDVTDPGHIRTVASAHLEAHRAFDPGTELNDRLQVIRYRDSKGEALLDFSRPKRPVVREIPSLGSLTHTEALGTTGVLSTETDPTRPGSPARSYQVIDLAKRPAPGVLATVHEVTQRVTNADTGTSFLLGKDGLTVIRRISIEEEYKTHQQQIRGN